MKKLLVILLILLSFGSYGQTITPVLYPLYMQGHGTSAASDEKRIPYACRMTVSGLAPNTTYNYYNRWALDPGVPAEQGGMIFVEQTGNWRRVTAPSLGSAANSDALTTDATGSYTGWFVSESNIATDFTPGNQLYFRIVLDLPGGTNPIRITSTEFVTVLAWDDYFDPVPVSSGTGVRSVNANTAWVPKNFIMLYDNTGGTGRPIASTYVEADGVANTTTNGYVTWYGTTAATRVNELNNRWGTIIPDDLPNGIQRIAQHSLSSGLLVNFCTDPDGDWGGANGNTVNPTGGGANDGSVVRIIDCTPTAPPSCSLSLSTTQTNVLCFGSNTGAINLTVTDAAGPVTYSWSNGATTEDLTGIPSGTYTVIVTESPTCTATTTVTVTQPASGLTVNSLANNATCGASNGSINLTVTGGTPPYTYLWSNGAITEDINGLGAGTYSVTVTDASGCLGTINFTLTNVAGPNVSATSTPVTTTGGTNGTATAAATGGTPPYTYLWSPGGQTTATATGLTAGNYSVIVTDANGCTATASATVGSPACNVTLSFTQTNVLCFGASTGSATVTAANTTGTVTYLWSNGQTTATASGLAGGTYSVTVTDGAACTATGSVTITQPGSAVVAAQTHTAILCFGGSSTVTISATGGTAPYTGTGTFSQAAGTQSYTVTDANGCTSSVSVTVAPAPTQLVASSTAPPITTVGGSTTVTVTATGGTAPYTGTGTFSRTAGTYTFTVTDANGCTATTTITLTEPGCNITLSTAVTNAACFGQNTGAVNLTVTGAVAPVTYLWSNGAITEDLSNVPAGTYSVTVTDAASCTATASATVIATDNIPPTIAFNQATGVTGPSSSATPYLQPVRPGVKFTSILTVPQSVGGYQMVGIPDGLGAFDNNNGTFTLLMNHELGNTVGVTRAHGAIGAFVSKWVIDKTTLQVQSGSDLMQQVYNWNSTTQSSNTTTSTIAFNRFCSADLPPVSAFYNAGSGLGSQARIFMHGEEGGTFGYQLATVATGADAGKAYILGKFNRATNGSGATDVGAWENALANPFAQDKTIVIGNNDGGTGIMANSVSVYVGTKTNAGSEVDKAGLNNGTLKFVDVTGNPLEIPTANATSRATNITNGTAFTLSLTTSTTFSRPEDGVWNPANPSQFFFVTTDRIDQVADGIGTQIGRSRLWRLNFTDITNPDLGGTIDLLLDGTEGHNMLDNMTADNTGHLILQEDVGGAAHNGKIWQYTIATDQLVQIAKHDPKRFGDLTISPASPYNNDEESSGVIDVSDILGAGMFLTVDQAHYNTGIPASAVEGGQLLAMFVPSSLTTATAADTVRVCAGATGVNLGTPATADNCSIASVTNNAPATFPAGITPVIWTVTDGSGNTATGTQIVVASSVTATATATALTCAGTTNDGTATVVAAGGTGTYTYSWSPSGGTGATATGLAPGTYTVTVTDASGCTATASATVAARLAATSSVATVACADLTGTVTLTATGGVAGYTFTRVTPDPSDVDPVLTGNPSAVFSNVPYGANTFTVTDAAGCVRTLAVTVTRPLVVSAVAGTIACGETTTTISVIASGGVGPYSGQTGNFTVGAGTYTYTVQDSRGCSASTTVVIAPAACYTLTGVLYPQYIQGSGTGVASDDRKVPYAARMTVSGLLGSTTYRYYNKFALDPSSPSEQGNYILVTQSGNFNRVTSASLATAGRYSEFTTDASGNYTGWFIGEPTLETQHFVPGTQLYFRLVLNDGAGGGAPVTRVTASQAVTVLGFGTTPADATGLRRIASTDYTAKNFVMLYNNLAGTGRPVSGTFIESDGTVENVSAGYAPFYGNSVDGADKTWGTIIPNNLSTGINNVSQYALSNGLKVNECTTATGVFGGTTDTKNANGGLTELVITSCNVACNLSLATSKADVSCFAGATGSINLTVTGAAGAVTYLWSNGAITEDLSGLTAGTYTVTVTEAANPSCSAIATVIIGQPASGITATASPTNLTCAGTTNDGTVNLTVNGGTPPYTYLWSNSATTEDLSGLSAGTYSVTVTDAKGCIATASATVAARLAATSSVATVACADLTGTVTLTGTGGVAGYTFTQVTPDPSDVNPVLTGNPSVVFTNVPYGANTFTVTDAAGCVRTLAVTVTRPLVVSAVAGTIACGETTTTISVIASGGVGPYSGQTGNFTVGAGTYTYTVQDSRGCSASTTVVIAPAACYTLTGVLYPQYIQGSGTGVASDDRKVPYAARMTVSGLLGSTTYRYYNKFALDPSSPSEQGNYILVTQSGNFNRVTSASLATAGRYSEFTTDASGNYTGWFIGEPTLETQHFVPGTQLYFRLVLNDGAGGGAPVTRVTASQAVTVLGFGTTPADATGLRRTASTDYTAKNFVMLYNNLAGTGRPISGTFIESDGTVENVSAGYAPFYGNSVDGADKTWGTIIPNNLSTGINNVSQYALSNGLKVNECTTATGVFGGTTDTKNANGGLTELVITSCNAPCNIVLTITKSDVSCNGGTNGTATVTATGTTGTVTYSWNTIPVQTTATATGLAAGTYTVTVTNGACTVTGSVTIVQPTALAVTATATPVTTVGGTNGTATADATGGTAPYTYSWSPGGQTTATATGLVAGTYTVTVTDSRGCTKTATATVGSPACNVTVTVTKTDVSCNGGTNGTATATATGTTGTVTYSWNTIPVQTTATATGLAAGAYTVTVTNGVCTATATVTIVQPVALVASSTAGIIACNGGSATVTVSATGGTAPYTGTGTFTRTAGTYSFTVTDAKGCTAVTSVTLTQPTALTATATSTPATSGSNGTATVTATGGTAPYTYLWNPGGQTTQTATGLAAGTYTVTVKDANNCTATATTTVAAGGCILAVNAGLDKVICSGASATLTASVTGVSTPTAPSTTAFTEVPGSTADLRLFSGNIDHITIGNTFSQSEDRTNCGKNTTSAKTLTIPAGAIVKRAYLYWSGSGSLDNQVKLNGTLITADGTKTTTRSGGFSYFAGRKDITSMVTASGTYTVSDLNWSNGSPYCYDNSAYGAWAMTVIYEKASLPAARIHVNTEQFRFTYPAGTYSTTINNISVPAGCSANATLTLVAFEGDNYKTEKLRIAGVLDANNNNFRGQSGPNLDILTKNAPSIVGGTTSLTYSIESDQQNTVFGPATEGLFDYVKVLKYNYCPGSNCNVTYQWKNGTTAVGTTQSISVSTAGTYVVTATDCAGCIATDEIVVSAATLAASSSTGTLNCYGGTTSVTVSATGGTAPYTGTGTFTKGAGTWSFTVKDATGCEKVTSVTITQPTQLVMTATAPAIPCGSTTTTVTVSASGGTAPYSGVATFVRAAGTYTFTVSDSKGCTVTKTITIASPVCGPVDPNKCYKLVNRNSGKVLSVENCSAGNNKKAEQRNSSDCMVWRFTEVSTGFYKITNVNSGKVLDVSGGSTSDNASVIQYTYGGGDNQKWSLTASGAYFVLKAKHSGKAMSVKNASTSNGAEVVQKGTGSNTNEQWSIVEVTCPNTTLTRGVITKGEPATSPVEELSVTAAPNPGISFFNLSIKSNDNTTAANVRILDANGKVLSVYLKADVNSTLRIAADKWAGGIYFAEVTQGGQRKVVKIVKLN